MKVTARLLLLFLFWFMPLHTLASYGASFTLPLEGNSPPFLRGYQLMLNYDPENIHLGPFQVYFDGGFSHFWVTNHTPNKSLNIYSAAPVLRYAFKKQSFLTPYLELSIGVSYMTKTRLDHRNLGMHFAFQDRAGIGALLDFNRNQQLSISIQAIHFSNAHLSDHNSGITAPLALDIGYQFS